MMKDWLMEVIMNTPQKDIPDEFIKVKEDGQYLVFMNFEKTIGLISNKIMSPEYRANCQDMTWDDFRKQNIINMMTGGIFFQHRYIKNVVSILKALNYNKAAITVLMPKKQSPVLFTVDNSEMALLLAPCRPRDLTSLCSTGMEEKKQ